MTVIYDAAPLFGAMRTRREALRLGLWQSEDDDLYMQEMRAVFEHSAFDAVRQTAAREIFATIQRYQSCAY